MKPEKKIQFQGGAGLIEARHRPAEQNELGLLMCHPHPLFDGTMDNKVVTTCTRAAAELELPTVRFNFRGVGASEGVHDMGVGEKDDVLRAIQYVKQELGWKKVILAGFSFGSGMACLAACEQPEDISKLILIAPPVHNFDAPSQLAYEFDTYVFMGDADEVVPFEQVEDWVHQVIPTPHMQIFEGAGHFFHGCLVELKEAVQHAAKPLIV